MMDSEPIIKQSIWRNIDDDGFKKKVCYYNPDIGGYFLIKHVQERKVWREHYIGNNVVTNWLTQKRVILYTTQNKTQYVMPYDMLWMTSSDAYGRKLNRKV